MYAYNPRKKPYHELEKSMVGDDRWDILNGILDEMDVKKGEGPKQHWIIIGPRGIGKSHLMTLLYYKVKNDRKLSKKWVPLLFPEELRMSGTLYKFLERALNEIILESIQKKEELNVSSELKREIAKIKKVPISERADLFFSLISWFHKETGKHILLITENLQYLMGKKFSRIEQKKLRAFLQTSDALLIIGSATTVFDALHDHSHPFYHFFHLRRLEDLSFNDMKTLIAGILSQRQQLELKKNVLDEDARLKTLYSFTGGNPRMAVFLADILSTDVPGQMLDFMDRILDELTPYFLTILEGIPDYLEEVLNTLAAFEPAQSPSEIAGHLEIPKTSIRNYLKQLKEDGYVRIAFSRGKSNYYCLNDYLYRVWYQMRDSSQREETRQFMELSVILFSRTTNAKEENQSGTYSPGKGGVLLKEPVGTYSENNKSNDVILLRNIKNIYLEYGVSFMNLNLPEIYDKCIKPLLEGIRSGDYLKEFYSDEKERKFSELQLTILLMLLEKFDVVSEHAKDIINASLEKTGEEKIDLELLIFSIKLSLWLKLIEGNIHEVQKLVEMYIEYIKALKTIKEKEDDVMNFLLDIFSIQLKFRVDPENVQKVLKRVEEEEGIPFSDVFYKVWLCLSEPDSVDAQRYLNEKAIAEVVKGLKEKVTAQKENE